LYVLHTLGADGGPLPERIEHMAAHYLKLICDFRPNGPYLLGGFCNGGLIAYEMSRQLRAQGREVGATVMVAAPAQRAKFRAVQRIVHGLGDFLGAPFQRQAAATLWVRRLYSQWNDPQQIGRNKLYRTLDDVATTFKNSIARIKSSASRAAAVSPGDAHMRAITPANMNRIFRHLGLAIAGYDPKPYHGRVLLLWPMEEPGWLRRGVIRGWKRVAKRLEVRLIPGNHMTCCTTHVQTLGRQLRGALQQPHRTAGEQN
jgi:thioesterase domain-containing protein